MGKIKSILFQASLDCLFNHLLVSFFAILSEIRLELFWVLLLHVRPAVVHVRGLMWTEPAWHLRSSVHHHVVSEGFCVTQLLIAHTASDFVRVRMHVPHVDP